MIIHKSNVKLIGFTGTKVNTTAAYLQIYFRCWLTQKTALLSTMEFDIRIAKIY